MTALLALTLCALTTEPADEFHPDDVWIIEAIGTGVFVVLVIAGVVVSMMRGKK